MGQNNSIPNLANVNQFKVMVGDSAFVVPDTIEQASPSGISSGLSPSTLFDSKRTGVGGYIFVVFSDAAGPTAADFQCKIFPGDSIIWTTNSGVATLQITNVNGTVNNVTTIAYTSVAGLQGYYS
jgi:hypothetical protein